jgi:DNA-binding XRE family transcriptional regulator
MSRNFQDYADERKAKFSQKGKNAYKVFSSAMAIGSVLATARRARVMTQRELAELSGVQQADISRIERGLLNPNTITFLRLIEAMDFQISILPNEKAKSPSQK